MSLRATLPGIVAIGILGFASPSAGSANAPCDAATMNPDDTPDGILCPGLRPGAFFENPAGGGCTLGFVVRDPTWTYFATAAHCLELGDRARLPDGGPEFGTTVFRVCCGEGNDFALIRVDGDRAADVVPEMCDWGGPTDLFEGGDILGRPVAQTGHGGGGGLPPRPRAGVGLGTEGAAFEVFLGFGIKGDSGSPVRLLSGEALGVITQNDPPQTGHKKLTGFLLHEGIRRAGEAGFPGLELVPG